MMKKSYTAAELAQLAFSDSTLTMIRWVKSGEDLLLSLLWKPPAGFVPNGTSLELPATLRCEWVTNFKLEMDFADFMGAPDIYELNMEMVSKRGWRVHFDFRGCPSGIMVFECNNLKLIVEQDDAPAK